MSFLHTTLYKAISQLLHWETKLCCLNGIASTQEMFWEESQIKELLDPVFGLELTSFEFSFNSPYFYLYQGKEEELEQISPTLAFFQPGVL